MRKPVNTTLTDLITVVHQPGFTTPAEARLIAGIVAAMTRTVENVAELKTSLHEGAPS
jgi:hypothetical protein